MLWTVFKQIPVLLQLAQDPYNFVVLFIVNVNVNYLCHLYDENP